MQNPFIKDENANLSTIRDPMILVVDDTYYLTGTQPPYWSGVNDGVHLWSSKDLVHFTDHGLILRREDMPNDMWCRDRFWAPELFDGKDGWFYLTFNCKNESEEYKHPFGVGLARAQKITGPYEILTQKAPLAFGIDGTLFRDDDGTLYLGCNGHKKLFIHKLDLETASVRDTRLVCESEENTWDAIGVEGQCIIKRHGLYFQWYSSWTDGYNAGLMTAHSMEGPWHKSPDNPILKDRAPWHHAGHNHSFCDLDGKDHIVFHANVDLPEACGKEQMIIRPVTYLPDGSCKIE